MTKRTSHRKNIAPINLSFTTIAVKIIWIAVVADAVTEFSREAMLSELQHDDDLFLMSETIVGLKNKFIKFKEVIKVAY